jgi:hypothetical protein
MSVLARLSSQVGDRTEASNRAVAWACLARPELLGDIAGGLASPDAKLAADCAEVLTMVAEKRPELTAPYFAQLVPLLERGYTRARWEAMHALSLIASLVPAQTEALLPRVARAIRDDASAIVRDCAVDAVANHAGVGVEQARQAYRILVEALSAWEGKHAGHALPGLARVAACDASYAGRVRELVKSQLDHPKKVVQRAAARVLRELGEG